jgi:hypothetical protein
MGHRIEFELRRRIVLLSFFGVVTEDSLLVALSEGIKFIRENGMEGAILDFSEIESFLVSMDFVRNYVNAREIVAPTKPRVAVAPQPAIYGTLRAFGLHAESTKVFPIPVRTMAEAYRILKLDSPVFGTDPWTCTASGAHA